MSKPTDTLEDHRGISGMLQLCETARDLYERGWLLGTAGNMSVRDEDHYIMSASGGHKGRLTPADFLQLRIGSRTYDANGVRASAEAAVHERIYEECPAAHAILHCHSPYVTLLSRACLPDGNIRIAGFEFIKGLGFWDEGAEVLVPIVPNHHDIPALAEAVAQHAAGPCPGVFVAAHGLYAWGLSVRSAQRHIECFEFLSHMLWEERRR